MAQIKLMRVVFIFALAFLFLLVSCSAYEVAAPVREQVVASPSPAALTAVATATPTVVATVAPTVPSPQGGGKLSARAYLEAKASSVGSSAAVEVEIVLDNVVDLYGAEVHLAFDPAILRIQDADAEAPGEQIALGEAFKERNHFVAVNRVDHQRGAIDLVVTLVNPAEPLQGRLVLATFSALAVGSGSTEIRFTRLLLADARANAMRAVSDDLTLSAKP